MKSIYLATLLFSLQFPKLITVTVAKSVISPAPSWLETLLRPRAEGSNPRPDTFICESTPLSPFNNHVIFGAEEMRDEQGHHWCIQENRKGSKCIQLVDYGTAAIAMCGEYRTKLRCNLITDIIGQLSRACATDFGGTLRLAGKAIFKWGYIEVLGKRVLDAPVLNK